MHPGLVLAGVTEVVEVVNQGIPMASRSGPPPLARVGLEAWRAAAPSTLRRRPWSAPWVGRRRLAPRIESAVTGEGRMLPVLMTTSAHVGGSPTSMTGGRSGRGGGCQQRRRRLYARIAILWCCASPALPTRPSLGVKQTPHMSMDTQNGPHTSKEPASSPRLQSRVVACRSGFMHGKLFDRMPKGGAMSP